MSNEFTSILNRLTTRASQISASRKAQIDRLSPWNPILLNSSVMQSILEATKVEYILAGLKQDEVRKLETKSIAEQQRIAPLTNQKNNIQAQKSQISIRLSQETDRLALLLNNKQQLNENTTRLNGILSTTTNPIARQNLERQLNRTSDGLASLDKQITNVSLRKERLTSELARITDRSTMAEAELNILLASIQQTQQIINLLTQ